MLNPALQDTVELEHSLWPNCNVWPFRTHGAFLGHVLSEEGVSQHGSKLDAIKNWPEIMTDLMKKDAFKVPFSDEVLESIAAFKSALTSAPVLRYFDSQKATELFVDASDSKVRACLPPAEGRRRWR